MNPYIRCFLPPAFDLDKLLDLKHWNKISSVLKVMKKLTHRMQVICAVTAAEIALPVWEKFSERENNSPQKAIDLIHKWLLGTATKAELISAAADANAAARSTSGVAYGSANAASYAAATIYTANAAEAASKAITYTVNATQYISSATGDATEAYIIWWDRCKPLLEEEYNQWSRKLRGEGS